MSVRIGIALLLAAGSPLRAQSEVRADADSAAMAVRRDGRWVMVHNQGTAIE
jgi:hypothetical protein